MTAEAGGAAAESGVFNIEKALVAFLADPSSKELQLPSLDTEQRKEAKKLAEQFPELKCESFGFGPERRLHLFKSSVSVKVGLVKDTQSCKEVQPSAECASDQSTAVSGAASPESTEETAGGSFEEGAALASNLYQVRNTFIHIEEQGVADQRTVQSMPHGMFRQRLQEEAVQSAQDRVAGPASHVQPSATATTPIAEVVKEMPEIHETQETLAPGTEVVIEGLTKYPAFNGLRGTIQSLDKASGRYNVQLAAPDGPLDQIAKIKGENLRMTVPPPPPFESSVCRVEETKSAMHARAPDFVPMQRMGLTSVPPNPVWQDPHAVPQPMYEHCQYDPYANPYPVNPHPVKYAAR
mmetsp:Transcript_47430/g.110922  ORF Transcript_47430/g.110922 Transcript_47430/m.110922 type:complete len:352 (+) Transcript_47430:118-1173(+)